MDFGSSEIKRVEIITAQGIEQGEYATASTEIQTSAYTQEVIYRIVGKCVVLHVCHVREEGEIVILPDHIAVLQCPYAV